MSGSNPYSSPGELQDNQPGALETLASTRPAVRLALASTIIFTIGTAISAPHLHHEHGPLETSYVTATTATFSGNYQRRCG
jgi:hypothetical protein